MSSLNTYMFEITLVNESVTKEQLVSVFFDLDFTGNQEYYRDDTLSLGYASEAERVATEMIDEDLLNAYDMLEACIELQCNSSGFYKESAINATRIDDTYVITVSVITE